MLVASAVVLVAAAFGLVIMLSEHGDRPSASSPDGLSSTTLHAPGQTSGRCMVPSAETLQNAALAFDGTVLEVSPDHLTFTVSRWYTGRESDRVEVADSPPRLRQLLGAPTFSAGDRYLVAGNADHQLMVCGFTAAYSSDLADLYSSAFGS